MGTTVLLVVAAAVTALVVLQRRARRRDAAERMRLFARVVPLLDGARRHGDGVDGHPVLTGRLDGRPVTLRPILDSVALRKLPVLWVEVVLHRPLDVGGTLNVLLRPQGTEFFSPDAGFAHEIPAPPDVPRPVRISCAAPEGVPPTRVLAPAAALLADPACKELAVGRGGVRAVLRVAEAEQASYRTTRRVVFDRPRLDPQVLAEAVAVLDAVGDAVAREEVRSS
ncbi:hypothetical protein Acsp06_52530 [Actinomycetospora sp. NBRC 106375]|uniref:hypothetical protein n=1 Tax=Actinomycetospora sp. NBRC 106375 TaxID=3032207 RepID=UPI0024A1E502|nr:hypothetical protein [Actinomycetospora sp. NBRC 106375]GLZ49068.1 hypothetical protein Acsp06_52530 [Actinomycetospora sp. NBRC 106375]